MTVPRCQSYKSDSKLDLVSSKYLGINEERTLNSFSIYLFCRSIDIRQNPFVDRHHLIVEDLMAPWLSLVMIKRRKLVTASAGQAFL